MPIAVRSYVARRCRRNIRRSRSWRPCARKSAGSFSASYAGSHEVDTSGKVQMGDRRSKIQYLQLPLAFMTEGRGETPDAGREGTETPTAKRGAESAATGESLMEEVCERENLEQAWQQVRSNQGSPGVDGKTIDETRDYLREHWPTIREQLLN